MSEPNKTPRSQRVLRLLLAGLAVAGTATLFFACSSPHPRRDPTGEVFPTVTATALDGSTVTLPEVAAGEPLLLLLGYEQDAQFDIDRWLLGLTQARVQVRVYEVPTLDGLVPRMISGTIDGGMRRGIPEEDWGGVVTVYDGAERLTRFTGDADGLTGRVLLLNGSGVVVFFHDRGYSVGSLQKLQQALAEIRSGG